MVEVWSLEAGGAGEGGWVAGLAVGNWRLKGSGTFTLLVVDEGEEGGGGKRRGESERHQWHISWERSSFGGSFAVWISVGGCYSRQGKKKVDVCLRKVEDE